MHIIHTPGGIAEPIKKGLIGQATTLKDITGTVLCVGDIVAVTAYFKNVGFDITRSIVVNDKDLDFPMGWRPAYAERKGEQSIDLTLLKSHKGLDSTEECLSKYNLSLGE